MLFRSGVMVVSAIVGRIFKWNPFLSIAVGVCCTLGYPMTYAVSNEIINGVTSEGEYTESEIKAITDYIMPKMIISGVVSVSVASVVLAGVISTMIF